MSDFLARMAASSRERAQVARATVDYDTLRAMALDAPPPPALCLHPSGFDVIAEVKLASPSLGRLAPENAGMALVLDRVRLYTRGGAAAVSVLTEPDVFGGHLDHLRAAALATRYPVMRKDFLVDPYQVWEAREAGAGGVLLIAALLDDAHLPAMCRAALDCGLFVLLECFDEVDLARAEQVVHAWSASNPPLLIGVNTRDLRSLAVDEGRLAALSSLVPAGCVAVAESGVSTPTGARTAHQLGYGVALVGTALMQASDPESATRAFVEAGRAVGQR